MNFLATPPQYADFVNTTGTAYMMPAATPLVKKTISQNPILVPTSAVLAQTEFDKYLRGRGRHPVVEHVGRDQGGIAVEEGIAPPRRATRPMSTGRLGHYALLGPRHWSSPWRASWFRWC